MIGTRVRQPRGRAFTLVELMVGMALMLMTLVLFASFLSLMTSVFSASRHRLDALATARMALGSMSEQLAAATLNARRELFVDGRWLSHPALPEQVSAGSVFEDWHSDLHFLCGPAEDVADTAPQNMLTHSLFFTGAGAGLASGRLRVLGYGLEHSADQSLPSFTQPATGAPLLLRLMEYRFAESALDEMRATKIDVWLTNAWATAPTALELARGIAALVIRPQYEVASGVPAYGFDSRAWHQRANSAAADPMRNRLPRAVELTLVVLENVAARRLAAAALEESMALTQGLFVEASAYDADMAALTARIQPWGEHRVFRSTVLLDHAALD